MPGKFTLGKKERLKSQKDIGELFAGGKKLVVSPYRVLYIAKENSTAPWLSFGTGVSAKNFKKAVDRNRVKRLTREAYRLQKNALQEKLRDTNTHLNIFFIYTAKELPLYDDVYKKIGIVLDKLDKLLWK